MSSPTAAQVLIVTAAGVYIFLAVMTGVLLGGDGFKLFLTTSSAEMMRLSLLSTVEVFFSPWSLMVVYTMFFTGLCTINWKETKSASSSVYKVASEATRAVWAVLSNPHKMLQYGMFVVMVRLFPDVVERLRVRQ